MIWYVILHNIIVYTYYIGWLVWLATSTRGLVALGPCLGPGVRLMTIKPGPGNASTIVFMLMLRPLAIVSRHVAAPPGSPSFFPALYCLGTPGRPRRLYPQRCLVGHGADGPRIVAACALRRFRCRSCPALPGQAASPTSPRRSKPRCASPASMVPAWGD